MPATAHVVKVNLGWEGQLGDPDRFVRVYTVQFDSPANASIIVAKTATDGTTAIPAPSTVHPEDATIWARRPSGVKFKGPSLVELTVEYSRSVSGTTPVPREPTTAAWTWWDEGEQTVETIDKDRDGNPIANSAGSTFAGVTEIFYIQVHRGVKLLTDAVWQALARDALRGSLNDGNVTVDGSTVTDQTGRITELNAEPVTIDGALYRRATISIAVRKYEPKWKKRILDEGNLYLETVGGVVKKKQFKDEVDGVTPDAQPRKLDGSGHPLADGGTPVWLKAGTYPGFETVPKVSWSGLSLT